MFQMFCYDNLQHCSSGQKCTDNSEWFHLFIGGHLRTDWSWCDRSSVIGRNTTIGWRSWCTLYKISWIRTVFRQFTLTTACSTHWVIPSAKALLLDMQLFALRRYSTVLTLVMQQCGFETEVWYLRQVWRWKLLALVSVMVLNSWSWSWYSGVVYFTVVMAVW